MNVFKRITNVINAITGRTVKCDGNCCHSEGVESISTGHTGPMGTSIIDTSGMHPDIAAMMHELALPEKQAELLAELDAAEDESACDCDHNMAAAQTQCIHLDYIPVCHCREGDMKPDNCSASVCPVRMFHVALEEMQKKAALIAYG
jgi:hypothetical protein